MQEIEILFLSNNDGFTLSTDKSFLDLDKIHHFLSKDSYWAEGIEKELVKATIENSILCFGIYEGNPYDGSAIQAGFARVVSDLVRFSWIGDVFILPEYRGRGLGKWLMSTVTEHPKLKGTSFQLATKDAHTLYAQFGFRPLEQVENRMARPLNWEDVYKGHNINK